MRSAVKNVNDTFDLLKDDLQRAVVSVGNTVENANTLIDDVRDDVKTIMSASARITGDAAEIADRIRNGEGTIGKLVNDDDLYRQATAIAKHAQEVAANTRQVVEQAREALESLQAKNGPVQGLTSNLKQTMDD